jgi:ubiquitin-protein ligase
VPGSALQRRIFYEIRKLERLESENKIIIDVNPLTSLGNQKVPPRFNNTTITERLDTNNILTFQARLLPQTEPYCRASFLIEIAFPSEYPFKGPKIIFLDPIYHPFVYESGRLCCDWGFSTDASYRPTTMLTEVIEKIIHSIDNISDEFEDANGECFAEYKNDYPTFYKKALERTLSYGRPRY